MHLSVCLAAHCGHEALEAVGDTFVCGQHGALGLPVHQPDFPVPELLGHVLQNRHSSSRCRRPRLLLGAACRPVSC